MIKKLTLLATTALLLGITGCKKDKDNEEVIDPCDGVTCLNGGTCDNGACLCPAGYEGLDCGTEARSKYYGNWQVSNEACTTVFPGTYTITITAGGNSGIDSVEITGLFHIPNPVTAGVSGNNLIIPSQPFSFATISGSGTLSGTTLTLNYTMAGGAGSETCPASAFVKQ